MLTLKQAFTAGDFRRGLETLRRPFGAAVLFGLELGLDAEDVVTFTWANVKSIRHIMSGQAATIVSSQPRHISSPYLFWLQNEDGMTFPLFGFSQELFDAFGMTWGELMKAHESMVWIDEDVERESWRQELEALLK